MRDSKNKFQSLLRRLMYLAACCVLLLVGISNAQTQSQTTKTRASKFNSTEAQQPIYREYRGVRLGMTIEEARAKLGEPVLKTDELDFYSFSSNETAQIAYNAARKVVTISADYTGGVGAPDYKTVVGPSLLERPDGSLYRMVQYEAEGFWVSYNKSSGVVPMVTITLQTTVK